MQSRVANPVEQVSGSLFRLKSLFFYRFFVNFSLIVIIFWLNNSLNFFTPYVFNTLPALWLGLAACQYALLHMWRNDTVNILMQFSSDLLLIGLLIFGSGGLNSPFIFLLGLVIIAAGTQPKVLMVLFLSVQASIVYLTAVYTLRYLQHLPLQAEDTIRILLQTSLFFLAGGIMALIAKRNSSLQQESQQTTAIHHQLKERYDQVLSTMEEGIIMLNDALDIDDFNAAAAKIIGINSRQTGYKLSSFLNIPAGIINHVKRQQSGAFQVECEHHNFILLLRLTKLPGDISSWLLTIVDITENKQLTAQLAEKDKLASIGQMAAMLAHEIRNPIQTVAQAVELMGLEVSNHKLEPIILSELSRLNRLVSDMLDYAHPLHPHSVSTPIKALIESSVLQHDFHQELNINIQTSDKVIVIDPDHFRLVLDNLLRNAIFFSPTVASIQISFTVADQQWELMVDDQGKGIAPEIRKHLFEPFRTGKKEGTGLGLATVWQVCHINHWQIRVAEDKGNGACFIVSNILESQVEETNHG